MICYKQTKFKLRNWDLLREQYLDCLWHLSSHPCLKLNCPIMVYNQIVCICTQIAQWSRTRFPIRFWSWGNWPCIEGEAKVSRGEAYWPLCQGRWNVIQGRWNATSQVEVEWTLLGQFADGMSMPGRVRQLPTGHCEVEWGESVKTRTVEGKTLKGQHQTTGGIICFSARWHCAYMSVIQARAIVRCMK